MIGSASVPSSVWLKNAILELGRLPPKLATTSRRSSPLSSPIPMPFRVEGTLEIRVDPVLSRRAEAACRQLREHAHVRHGVGLS
jgi:hypothetical protein